MPCHYLWLLCTSVRVVLIIFQFASAQSHELKYISFCIRDSSDWRGREESATPCTWPTAASGDWALTTVIMCIICYGDCFYVRLRVCLERTNHQLLNCNIFGGFECKFTAQVWNIQHTYIYCYIIMVVWVGQTKPTITFRVVVFFRRNWKFNQTTWKLVWNYYVLDGTILIT